jgi:predicted ester cyclase
LGDLQQQYLGYLKMINERRFADSPRFAHDQITFSGKTMSRDDYFGAIVRALQIVPDFRWELDNIVVSGEWVAARVIGKGTPISQWLGFAPNGRQVTFVEHAFYHFPEGRIAKVDFVRDVDAIRTQLAAQ